MRTLPAAAGALLVLLLLWLLPGAGRAADLTAGIEGEAPVRLEADELTYDQEAGVFHAQGQVRLRRGELTLLADEMFWYPEERRARAVGSVRLEEASGWMAGESLTLDLDSGLGSLSEGRIFIRKGNFRIAGEEIARVGEQSFRVTGGSFTTCAGPDPSWKFAARDFRVTEGGYARARHVAFYLRDLPVFYLPYFLFPAMSERTSGFLLPDFGYSRKRGAEFSLPFYLVLGRNQDATFTLDYLSDLGLGKGLEYRYIFGRDSAGEVEAHHVTGLSGAEDRFRLDWRHEGTLPGRVRLAVDAHHVNRRDYFEDFGEEPEEYNKDQLQSVVYAARNWGLLNLAGQLKYTKDLTQENDRTLQRLPELRLFQVRRQIGGLPLYGGLDASATHFWREEGLKGTRAILRPSLSAAFHPGEILHFLPEVGYRQRLYWTSEEEAQEGLFDVSARLAARLFRVYDAGGGRVRKVRHSLEPELFYAYVPDEDEDRLPQFDREDEIGPQNRLGYALTNRFVARLEPEAGPALYHEFLYLRLSQSYDFSESRPDLLEVGADRHPFSELRGELIVRPTRWSYLDLDGRFDLEQTGDNPAAFFAGGGFRDGSGNRLAFDYRFRREELEYADGSLDLALLRPVYLNYRHRYDLAGSRSLEKLVGLEYRAQCWSVALSMRDRLEDTEYLVTFSLAGLGRVGQVGGEVERE